MHLPFYKVITTVDDLEVDASYFFYERILIAISKIKFPTDDSSFDLIMSKKDQSIYVKMWKMFLHDLE